MEKNQKTIIGIIGCGPGVGVTHLCIALAEYSASHQKNKTAVIELSGNHAIADMGPENEKKKFTLHRVTYYPDSNIEQMPEIISQDYHIFILDFGCEYYRVRPELLRCDKKIVVGSLSPWKRKEYEYYISEVIAEEKYRMWNVLLVTHGTKKDKKEFQKQFHISVVTIPHIENPFEIEKNNFIFLQGLL